MTPVGPGGYGCEHCLINSGFDIRYLATVRAHKTSAAASTAQPDFRRPNRLAI
jgi:hypothetical protein